jgi:L-alanine-DL-glutamate epimerase-like enolase superfamily enzyme
MKITAIKTLRLAEFANIIWVVIETDEGITGLGETFFGASAVEAYIHDWCAPRLIGKNPLHLQDCVNQLHDYIGWRGAGVETRAYSALDIALWDLFAKMLQLPLADALGGRSRDQIRTYNTCAGYKYVRDKRGQSVENWNNGQAEGPYEDLEAFLTDAGALAQSLLDDGITAMKIWPFDIAAERSGGLEITPQELRTALKPFEQIRSAVGDDIDIMVEFHSLWSLPMAKRIARELAPFKTYWHEDPFRMDTPRDIKDYAQSCDTWVCASETFNGTPAFRQYLETGCAGVVMLDLSWCGGVTEARKIAGIAEAWKVPVAPHDCTGPVVYAASCHLSMHAKNALIQESVRAFYTGWYPELAEGLPQVERGMITLNEAHGHGIALKQELWSREDATIRRTA